MDKLIITYKKGEVPVINEDAFDGTLLNSMVGEEEAIYEFDNLTKIYSDTFTDANKKGNPFGNTLVPISVKLPDSLKWIDKEAFRICKDITGKLVTADGLVIIDGELHANLYYDTKEIVVPEGVTSIGECAFSGDWITKVILPSSLRHLGKEAFAYCGFLKSVKLNKGLETIGDSCFKSCRELGSITIPDTVTKVGSRAFHECWKLKKVKIGKAVQEIGDGIIGGCQRFSALDGKFVSEDKRTLIVNNCLIAYVRSSEEEEYIVPEGVTRIGDYAFDGTKDLKRVTLPSTLESIGEHAFRRSGVTEIDIPENVTSIHPRAFSLSNIMKYTGKYVTPDNECVVIDSTLVGVVHSFDYNFATLTIPESATEIGDGVMEGNFYYQDVVWHNGIRRIGDEAFRAADISMSPNELPEGLEEIGICAFADGPRTSTIFPYGVIIPTSVKKIGVGAFSIVYSKTAIYFAGIVPPEWIPDKDRIKQVFVPAEALETYKQAFPKIADIINVWEHE